MVKKENSELDSENKDQFMSDRNCIYFYKVILVSIILLTK
jgi:hypothetical protein